MMHKFCFLIVFSIANFSCIYKSGNRQPDVNRRYDVSISPFYIKKYMKGLDSFYANRLLITSEIVNYPDNFVPITDSMNGYKYVIEFHSLDSVTYLDSHYINLASVYDFKKKSWIKDEDSLSNIEYEMFKKFFKDSVLEKTVSKFMGAVQDSLLFVDKSHLVEIKELR